MKTTFLIAAILAICVAQNFDEYLVKFNKHYTPEERIRRQAIYLARMAEINTANAQNPSYTRGENQFTDLTDQEIKIAAGLRPIVIPDLPITQPPQRKLRSGLGVPLAVDWRTEGKVSAVKYQGTCGSCWAFTATALYESILMIGGTTPQPDLSEQYVLQCTTANSPQQTVSSCNGGILQYAIPFVQSTGIPPETDFPYSAASFTVVAGGPVSPTTAGICTSTNLKKDTTLNATYMGSYVNLTMAQMQDLVSYAPIAVAMYATNDFMQYTSGIYTGCPDFASSVGALNHAVLLIGYDASGNYIIKNSWGTQWGENGFGTISKDNDCALSYAPRELRGTNAQLTGSQSILLAVSLIIAIFISLMM